ncbi:MAG: PaaI family thioesterase [Deltaproteobacteria bacterium]|nr:PaaI family thioesterase [Deltaproteobacteria bacterium]
MKQSILDRIDQAVSGRIPHNAALGMRAVACGPDDVTLSVPYDARLVGNPETGVLHGGVITTLIDATCGMAVFMKLGKPTRIATLDLRIDYLKPASPGRAVLATAECYKMTRQVAFVRALAYHDSKDDPIASSAGTFMIFSEGASPMVDEKAREP